MHDWSGTIQEMRRAALQKYQTPEELLQIRKRFRSARVHFFRTVMEGIAQKTKVDLRPFYEDTRRRIHAQYLESTQVMDKLEARAADQALEEKKRLDLLRREYLQDFPKPYELASGLAELKFNIPIYFLGLATPGECNELFGGGLGGASNFGTYEATADMSVTLGQPGVQFFPRIYLDAGDCDTFTAGQTFQELFFRLPPLDRAFLASSVRVDLFGGGLASNKWGDLGWGFDPYGGGPSLELQIQIAQIVRGNAQYITILDKVLFSLFDEAVQHITLLTSLDDNPINLVLRGSDVGGEIGCYMILRGFGVIHGGEGGRVLLNFAAPNYGLALTGISLIGEYL